MNNKTTDPKFDKFILDDNGVPVVEHDLLKWAMWMENKENRRVAYDETKNFHISTVFLGLDHDFADTGTPVLYETMVFSNVPKGGLWQADNRWQERYHTREEALKGHSSIVKEVQEADNKSVI